MNGRSMRCNRGPGRVSEPARRAEPRGAHFQRAKPRMSDISTDGFTPSGNGSEGPAQPGIRILAQYIKDLSFESPKAPESLRMGATAPQIDLNVELNANGREDGPRTRAELKLTARASRDPETVFHLELVYAGLLPDHGRAGHGHRARPDDRMSSLFCSPSPGVSSLT